MDTITNILEDNSLQESKKWEMINTLIDTKIENQENIRIEDILNLTTKNVKLKCDLLEKIFINDKNLLENINYFIKYFKKTFHDIENQELLARILIFLWKIVKDTYNIQTFIENVGIENVTEVILNKTFLQESDYKEKIANLKNYMDDFSVAYQTVFFNKLFEFSKRHENVDLLCLTLDNINITVLTDEKSVFRTKNFWIFLTTVLENCKNIIETQKVVFTLETCINLCKNSGLDLRFLSTENDEKAWNAFLVLVQVCNYGENELLKLSLELLNYISPLHFFWKDCILKLLVKRTTNDLTCQVLTFFLKQPVETDFLQNTFETMFFAINEHRCIKEECPVFKELKSFCENLDITYFQMMLDEILNVSWNLDTAEMVMENVLVELKKNLVDFSYFYRFEILLNAVAKEPDGWPNRASTAVLKFFGNSENFDNLCKIRRSSVNSNYFWLENSENLKDEALKQILQLSDQNSEDLDEIQMYFSFIRSGETYCDLLKNYPLSIHVRLIVYKLLFNMYWNYYAECCLDQETTVNDFYEYLIRHLNEKTYIAYTSLMASFLELNGRFIIFEYPKKACSEIVNIMQSPELYTKYQIYCAAEILKVCYYRFYDVWGAEEKNYYRIIGLKWKNLILETEDENLCELGLHYVLDKGQLNEEANKEIVKKILEKHLCDNSTEEIYRRYLSPDLMNFAFKHLNDIKQHDQDKYEHFSQLFCKAVMSEKYISSNQFSYKNEEYQFCLKNTKNLENSMLEIYFNLLNCPELKRKTLEITYEIYLNKLINITTKVNCLHVLIAVVSRTKFKVGTPPPFVEPFKECVNFILKKSKETYEINLKDEIIKLRIVQALFLLIYYLMLGSNRKTKKPMRTVNVHEKLRNKLKRIAVGILVKEKNSKNKAVRQICQHMYILLSEYNVTFEDIKCIIEKVKEHPDLTDSFMPVLYHIISFYKFSKTEIAEMFEYMLLLSQIQYDKLKVYSKLIFQHIYDLYNNQKFRDIVKSVLTRYKTTYEQIDLDLQTNKNQIADLLGVDYIFLKILDPKRDHSLETLLEILPKLNQVDSSEWKDITKPRRIWCANIDERNDKKDKSEILKKSVDEFLRTKENVNNKYLNYSVEDVLEMFKHKPTKEVLNL